MRQYFLRWLIIFGAALPLALATPAAKAVPVAVELALLIDGSGSISDAEFGLQKNAYVSVLGSSLIPTNGSLTVGVWVFGGTSGSIFQAPAPDVDLVFALRNIDSLADRNELVTAVANMARPDTGKTAIGQAIIDATTALIGLGNMANPDVAQIIDVSTDGAGNVGPGEDTEADNAITAGVEQVNCIGIGGAANCGFFAGTDSFFLSVSDFVGFEDALAQKIGRESVEQISEPGTLALFGLGLAAFGALRRRRDFSLR